MDNDTWTALLDRLPADVRGQINAHFEDVFGGYLKAILTMLTAIEARLTALEETRAAREAGNGVG